MSETGSRAVVWDLDGVIVDSGKTHNKSWEVLAAEYGLPYDPERDFKGIFGKHNDDIINKLWNISDREQLEQMGLRKEVIFRDAAQALQPLPGVPELMAALRRAGWKQGIGSSAPLANVTQLLSVSGLAGYMEAIATGEDVTKGKPDPQVFLVAFERLGVSPSNGVVIEDAPAGVEGGRASRAATIGVTNTQTAETLKAAGADLVLDTLEGLTVADLERLIEAHRSGHPAQT